MGMVAGSYSCLYHTCALVFSSSGLGGDTRGLQFGGSFREPSLDIHGEKFRSNFHLLYVAVDIFLVEDIVWRV